MQRLERAICSLHGLSVGDGFGEKFFHHYGEERKLPDPPWHYTDDTQMALSIVSVLRQYDAINQDALAMSFANNYEPTRGYGAAMHGALTRINRGESWYTVAHSLFGGEGSFGNGSAMRVAPLGGYFADDLDVVAEQARRSAEVTHAHHEGIAGAIAVAIAAALAWQMRGQNPPAQADFFAQALPYVPASEVRASLLCARDLPTDASLFTVVSELGNGSRISAQDTVAFTLWCASHSLQSYEEALWMTASAMGDVDTTCAIVGGIVALYGGLEAIPVDWLNHREALPEWYMQEGEA